MEVSFTGVWAATLMVINVPWDSFVLSKVVLTGIIESLRRNDEKKRKRNESKFYCSDTILSYRILY